MLACDGALLWPIWLQHVNGPSRRVRYHVSTEYRFEVGVSAIVFRPVRPLIRTFDPTGISHTPAQRPSPERRWSTYGYEFVILSNHGLSDFTLIG
ncbi:hypothetical protein EVAR_47510_1 [Eumeta japonica]|uniref:Uncharacterized protein n=1 Tax=Eumeta variegata TaxID=151549 RepID=A0A4C1XS67_EUMVA|nr:hypothetical protein EVAR_47510_1 [Eumeta japonica]